MRSRSWNAVLAAALAAGAAAQNATVPALLGGVEGASGTNVPFGSNLACRYQCLYDAEELPWAGPRVVLGISLRADNGSPAAAGPAIAAKGFVELSVLLSTTHVAAADMRTRFEDNYGEDAMWVVNALRIQLPAQAAIPAGPRAANIDLPFTTPWVYGLTPARQPGPPPRNLLVEIWIHSQPSGSYRVDDLGNCQAAAADFGRQDPLCTVPGGPPLLLETDRTMEAGSVFSWTMRHAPADSPFLLAINGTNQGTLFGAPGLALPYPMFDPRNPSQPPPGLAALRWSAPDCWFNVDPVAAIFGVADGNGTGIVATSLPAGRQLVGTTLYGQALAFAPTANTLQLVSSLGRHSTVCGPLGVARVFAFYNGTAPIGQPAPQPPATGSRQYGVGMVFDVR
jgi:hypothetical protein